MSRFGINHIYNEKVPSLARECTSLYVQALKQIETQSSSGLWLHQRYDHDHHHTHFLTFLCWEYFLSRFLMQLHLVIPSKKTTCKLLLLITFHRLKVTLWVVAIETLEQAAQYSQSDGGLCRIWSSVSVHGYYPEHLLMLVIKPEHNLYYNLWFMLRF